MRSLAVLLVLRCIADYPNELCFQIADKLSYSKIMCLHCFCVCCLSYWSVCMLLFFGHVNDGDK